MSVRAVGINTKAPFYYTLSCTAPWRLTNHSLNPVTGRDRHFAVLVWKHCHRCSTAAVINASFQSLSQCFDIDGAELGRGLQVWSWYRSLLRGGCSALTGARMSCSLVALASPSVSRKANVKVQNVLVCQQGWWLVLRVGSAMSWWLAQILPNNYLKPVCKEGRSH